MPKDAIFYPLWYNVICWSSHICKKSSFFSFYSFLVKFTEWHGKWWSKIDKVWQNWIGWKMPLCKWHTFWMAPSLICYFIVVFFYVERKWLLMENLSTILPLKSKLSPKFQRFNTLDRFSVKIKNWKTARSKQRAALRKFFSFPPTHPSPNTILLRLWNKNFITQIYRNKQAFTFKAFQECGSCASRKEIMQCKCYFLRQIETCLLENLENKKGFWLLWEQLLSMSS